MKKIFCLIASAFLICGLSGCSGNDKPQIPQAPVSDPFAAASEPTKNGVTTGSYGVKSGLKDEVSYSGGYIEATQYVTNGGSEISLGFSALIDGIPQTFSDGSSLSKVTLKPEEKITLPLEIAPSHGTKGETLQMNILSMYNPNFVPKENEFVFGNYHNTISGFPVEVHFETSIAAKEIAAYTEHTIRIPTDTENEYYDLSNGTSTICRLLQDENGDYFTAENNDVSFKFIAYSVHSETFRISLYKNHVPVKINGCDVADIKVSKGRVTELPINLGEVNAGDFVYAIATPMTNNMLTPEKTPSVKIMGKDFSMPVDDSSNAVSKQSTADDGLIFLNADDTSLYFYKYIADGKVQIVRKNRDNSVTAISEPIDADMVNNFIMEGNLRFIKATMNEASAIVTLNNDLKLIEELDINKLGIDRLSLRTQHLDILGNRLLFRDIDRNIAVYDFDAGETTVVAKNDAIESKEASIGAIRFLNEQQVAFVKQIHQPKSYSIGILDLSTNKIVEKPLASISTTFDTAGGVACWNSHRMDNDEVSDGIIHLYYGDSFHEIRCENPNESQNVFLSNDGKRVATYYASGDNLTVSAYGVQSGQKSFEKTIKVNADYNTNNTKICIVADEIYIYDVGGDKLFEVFDLEGSI